MIVFRLVGKTIFGEDGEAWQEWIESPPPTRCQRDKRGPYGSYCLLDSAFPN